MEALAAIALAGNVIQFLETGSKLVRCSKEILDSEDGAAKSVQELIEFEAFLRPLAERLVQQAPDSFPHGLPASDSLQQIAISCHSFLDEVKPILADLKAPSGASRRQALRTSARVMRHRKLIEGLGKRLDSYRAQIASSVLEVIMIHQSTLSVELERLSKESKAQYVQSFDALNGINGTINHLAQRIEELNVSTKAANREDAEIKNGANAMSWAAKRMEQTWDFPTPQRNRPPVQDLADEVAIWTAARMEQVRYFLKVRACQEDIVSSLWYETIAVRHEQITAAYARTFQWAFQPNVSTLHTWLESGTGLYWITGKPGCGKSTFMKFLHRDQRTQSALQLWSSESELVTAAFYFWRHGNPLQRSIHGLLQSLVYEITRTIPVLIPIFFPRRWRDQIRRKGLDPDAGVKKEHVEQKTWSSSELRDALFCLRAQTTLPLKMCLFIDGLDEYEGNYRDAISLLRSLADSDCIKICVASRPENAFQIAFETSQNLIMHTLTRSDIDEYVTTEVSRHPEFRAACQRERVFQYLLHDIQQKAEGVFLWVQLAVSSLLDGLEAGDTVSDLRARLNELPKELDDLFGWILRSIEVRYRKESADIFRFCLLMKRRRSPLLVVPHLDRTPSPTPGAEVFINREAALEKVKMMRRRVNARCRGLMDCKGWLERSGGENSQPESIDNQFDFNSLYLWPIHRTVWEFLEIHYLNSGEGKAYASDLFVTHYNQGYTRLVSTILYCQFQKRSDLRDVVLRTLAQFGRNHLAHKFHGVRDIEILGALAQRGSRLFAEAQWSLDSRANSSIVDHFRVAFLSGESFRWYSWFTFMVSSGYSSTESESQFINHVTLPPSDNLVLQAWFGMMSERITTVGAVIVSSYIQTKGVGLFQDAICSAYSKLHGTTETDPEKAAKGFDFEFSSALQEITSRARDWEQEQNTAIFSRNESQVRSDSGQDVTIEPETASTPSGSMPGSEIPNPQQEGQITKPREPGDSDARATTIGTLSPRRGGGADV